MFAYAISLMSNNPGMLLFMNREAGTMILMKLVQDIDKGLEDTPRRSFFADVATRFGISRTHVRTTLQHAQEAGLARISHTDECIGAPNQRKLLCSNDFLPIRGASRCRQSVAQISLDLHL
jgi:hypothetical protein